jgi:hypothetical protein
MAGDTEFMRATEEQNENRAKLRAELERVDAERTAVAKLYREADDQVAKLGLELHTERERADRAHKMAALQVVAKEEEKARADHLAESLRDIVAACESVLTRASVALAYFDFDNDDGVLMARNQRLARENYGLLLMLQDAHGDLSADALRATAESKAREALGEGRGE